MNLAAITFWGYFWIKNVFSLTIQTHTKNCCRNCLLVCFPVNSFYVRVSFLLTVRGSRDNIDPINASTVMGSATQRTMSLSCDPQNALLMINHKSYYASLICMATAP